MTGLLAALCILAGVVIVGYAVQTAIRTFLLPQPGLSLLSRSVFVVLQPFFAGIDRLPMPARRRHGWQSIYAPLALLLIVVVTLVIIALGFTLIFYGLGLPTLEAAFLASISSVSTLGFATLPSGLLVPTVSTIETMLGILVVSLLIGYLPTIYAAVRQREERVAALAAHVGMPLSGAVMLLRHAQTPGLEHLDQTWSAWHDWFAALGHSHNTLAGIIFARSPQPDHSWVTAAGTVLDAAALAASTLDAAGGAGAERCLAVGSQTLAGLLAGGHGVDVSLPRRRASARQVTQPEFAAAYATLHAAGLPVAPDHAAAWQRFAAWRSHYEAPLHTLAHLTHSPLPAWPGDHPAPPAAADPPSSPSGATGLPHGNG